MKKTRKLLCFVLSLLMVICLFPITSQAVTTLPVSGNNWSLDDDGLLTITNDTGMNDWLTSVNGKFHYNGYVENVVIGNAVTAISANAFQGLSDLTSVTIGNSVTNIGAFAFEGCTGLTSLTLPASVTTIGNSAFNCANLESVIFKGTTPPISIGTTVFSTTTLAGIYVPENSVDAYKTAFSGYASLIKPISVAITKDDATTYYPTLTNALTAAQNGDTVTLLNDITESSIYTISADTIVTIDGMGHTVTGTTGPDYVALRISGTGTLNLKDITLQGGAGTVSKGLVVSGSVNVNSYGTVAANGARCSESYGLVNNGSGTVNLTTVCADGYGGGGGFSPGYGVYNAGSGTVNVSTATVLELAMVGAGVYNGGSGTVNVGKAEGPGPYIPGSNGIHNAGTGTVNVGIATGYFGVDSNGAGTVNAGIASASAISPYLYSVYNSNSGTVNVSTIIGTTSNGGTGNINTGASVAAVTLSIGDGATCVLDTITVASTGTTTIGKLPSVCKNGTYSDVWYTDSSKTTLFTGTTVTGAATLYSYYYTEPTVTPGSSKHSSGGGSGISAPEITKTVSGNTTTFNIPKAALGLPANGGTDAFKVSAADASISFDKGALSTIMDAAGDIKITASKIDTANLSEETKQLVGDRPVFDFSVTSENKTISQFGGTVTVSVPYTPATGEDPNAIVIYYINAEGKPEMVSNCVYDSSTGTITFTTDHFSTYAVGYNKVSFNDVAANAWYGDAVSFVAARDITTGTGNGNYSPDTKLTRGQFLVMVMRAYGIEADSTSNDNFSDAGNTYYTGYLAAAKSLGITDGIGNNMFAPEKEITRQEMFTLLYNTLDSIGELPAGTTGNALNSYSDAGEIASWAKDAMTLFVGTGTISGSGNQLNPADTTNRAQMAQVLYNLLSK